ncbi:MAG: nucleoside recognition protein [Lachnospiraceae bacterium]|nr:nucleoside recognition protein [Lachnospiraceae bacterium]
MDYLWAGMLLIGILYGALTGNITEVSDAALSAAGEAISLCITTAGVLTLWTGLMEIAKTSGIITSATKAIHPLITFLFPNLPKDHPAAEHISLNFIANFLGLNWGATPAGLKAMEELANLEQERGNPSYTENNPKMPRIASDEMCTFLIINISSLQLIPINIIAYRQQYGSVTPTAIIGPAIIATLINTIVAIIFCKIMQSPHFTFMKKKNRKSQ